VDELDEIRLVIEELHAGLDTLPYHVFLGVAEDARGDELRDAYHRRAQTFHPDRFYSLGDPALRSKVYAVFKRITEAYRVLGNPESRRAYLEQRGQGAVRLDPLSTSRRPAVRARPEDAIAHPGARKYYLLALAAERDGDVASARVNLRLALQLAPGDEVIRSKLEALGTG
jgi:curved DNA-binding protein CbpA